VEIALVIEACFHREEFSEARISALSSSLCFCSGFLDKYEHLTQWMAEREEARITC